MKKHIFSIMAGCMPVGIKMLDSYFEHHEDKIHIYCFSSDTDSLVESISDLMYKNYTVHVLPESIKSDFTQGHAGTAKVWRRVIEVNQDSYLIHIDSDIIFKKESLSLIEKAGYPDIYGSRRCYKNNPGKSPVPEGVSDSVSTYFLGLNPFFLIENGKWKIENAERAILGGFNPLGFPVLDFFDPISFWMQYKGASVFFEDQNIIGGQNTKGSKVSSYPSNMHLDMGSHMAHFGGVGSGLSTKLKLNSGELEIENMNEYQKWSLDRWEFFEDLFYIEHPTFIGSTKIDVDESGRWVSGPYNEEIWEQVNKDLQS